MILKSQGKDTDEEKTTDDDDNTNQANIVNSMEVKKKTNRKKGPSTLQVVFCFCCRGGNGNAADAKKIAAINRQAEDDF